MDAFLKAIREAEKHCPNENDLWKARRNAISDIAAAYERQFHGQEEDGCPFCHRPVDSGYIPEKVTCKDCGTEFCFDCASERFSLIGHAADPHMHEGHGGHSEWFQCRCGCKT